MSEVIEAKLPCDHCGSSDAYHKYDDGHGFCFSCEAYDHPEGTEGEKPKRAEGLLPPGSYQDHPKRRIKADTFKKFGYSRNGKWEIAPYREIGSGRIIAQHLRGPKKEFKWKGEASVKKLQLFGQHLWRGRTPDTPRDRTLRLVITEGEYDAMSYAEATYRKWPVVSLPSGATSAAKAIKANLEFVESFDQVIFMFDMDDAGQKAAKECAELVEPGKAAIASLSLKDASDMLQAGRVAELTKSIWDARPHRPDGIINGSELWGEISKPIEMGTPYPWPFLNDMLYGLRSEIVTLTAGTGIGKSAVTAEIAYHLAVTLGKKVGYVALEEGISRTGLRFVGLHLNKPLHLPGDHAVTEEAKREAFQNVLGTERFYFYDHFGSLDSENLMLKLRYMAKGLGVEYLFLDHLSIVVSGMDLEGDERRMLDYTMTKLRSFVEETDTGLILVSHLKRPYGKGHEEGAQTSLAQLRGSAAIAQLSDGVIGLERNQQADGEEANKTVLRVLKNRYAGLTGIAGALAYDQETGRLTPTDLPEDFEEEDGDDF